MKTSSPSKLMRGAIAGMPSAAASMGRKNSLK